MKTYSLTVTHTTHENVKFMTGLVLQTLEPYDRISLYFVKVATQTTEKEQEQL